MSGPDLDTLLADAWHVSARAATSADESKRDHLTRRVRSRRRRAHATRAVVATAASAAVVAGGFGVAQAMANRGQSVLPASPEPTDQDVAASATTLLVLRTDTMGDEPGSRVENDTDIAPSLDSVAIVHIAAGGARVEILSLYPRADVMAPACALSEREAIPAAREHLDRHVNAALELGAFADGIACAEATVAAATGLVFDGVVATDFAGFIEAADALGGATMCIPEPIEAEHAQLSLEAGWQRLNGDDLLKLARARNGAGLGGGDEQPRAEREARVLAALTVAARNQDVAALLEGAYVTGAPAELGWAEQSAVQLSSLSDDAIVPMTVPMSVDADGQGSWGDAAQQVFAAIASDTPAPPASVATATCEP